MLWLLAGGEELYTEELVLWLLDSGELLDT